MNEPKFDSQATYPYQRIGWYLITFLFIFLIFGELSGSIRPRKGPELFTEDEIKLERSVMHEILINKALPTRAKEKRELEDLNEVVSELVDYKNKNTHAARLYITIRYEKGKKILPEDLEILKKSKNKIDQAFTRIYLEDHLTKQEASSLASQLPNTPFSNLLAKVHAYEKAGDKNARNQLLPLQEWSFKANVAVVYILLLFVGAAIWLIYFRIRSKRKWKPKGHPLPCHEEIDADRNVLRFGLYFIILILGQGTLQEILKIWLQSTVAELITRLLMLALILWVLRLKLFGKRSSLKKIIGETKKVKTLALWGASASLANLPILLVATLIGIYLFPFLPSPTHPVTEKILQSPTPWTLFNLFLLAAVFAPVTEEITFRGLLLPALSKALNSNTKGILLSSFLFAAIHPQGITLWPALAAVGAMAALLAYQTRSLIPSIIMHAIHNTLTLLFTYYVL